MQRGILPVQANLRIGSMAAVCDRLDSSRTGIQGKGKISFYPWFTEN
jgi:hypothetical protein